jgi:competence protein ComFC
LTPEIHRRKFGTLEVVSLFGYKSIESFLLTKHTPAGYRIYKYFGDNFAVPFIQEFAENIYKSVTLVGIDESIDSGYSHSALLMRSAGHPMIKVAHGKLLSRNNVKYAGKTLEYRLQHPRDFRYTGKSGIDIILVDDIVTTGTTLQEAQKVLAHNKVNVLFALTLADAKY